LNKQDTKFNSFGEYYQVDDIINAYRQSGVSLMSQPKEGDGEGDVETATTSNWF